MAPKSIKHLLKNGLRRVLGASSAVLACLGASWARLGASLARLRSVLARLGASWARVGLQKPALRAHGPIGYRLPGAKPCAKSGCPSSWAHRVRVLGASWARLGRVLAHLGGVLARLGRILARLGRVLGAFWSPKTLPKSIQDEIKNRSKNDP